MEKNKTAAAVADHHDCQHSHHHEESGGHTHEHRPGQGCSHGHNHGKTPVIMFFVGLVCYLAGLILNLPLLMTNVLFVAATLAAGYHVIGEGFGDTFRDSVAQKRFAPNIHLLMTLAAAGAIVIGNFEEAALLILIFAGAHFLEEYAEGKSKREITKLLKLNPTEARLLLANGQTKTVAVDQLNIGDQVQVLNGAQVPTDGIIVSGMTTIDESSINGESIPKEKTVGDEVFGSTINGVGTFIMEVTKDSTETVFAKILQLVNQSQSNLSKTATKIKKIEPIYIKIVLALLPIVILVGPFLLGWSWELSFYRGMVFLISASPCALAASAVPATLSGISNLAKKGVLFKGGSYLANLSELKAVAFDKTGTLTQGKPQVTDYDFGADIVQAEKRAAVVAAMERNANHPLATAIAAAFADKGRDLQLEVTNEIGKGLFADWEQVRYHIGKPALFTDVSPAIAERQAVLAGEGKTVVYVAENDRVVGWLALMDVPNEAARKAIAYFQEQRVHTTMITGDAEITGQAVGRSLGIDQVAANVLPEKKSAIIAEQQQQFGMVGMVGDGVNDAPALVNADIGIAMGDGTDVAIDVADVVLMQNDLSKLVAAHKVAKRLNKIVWQNIAFSMLVVVLLVSLNFIGKMDIAVGVIAHEGSTIVVILNGLRMLISPKHGS